MEDSSYRSEGPPNNDQSIVVTAFHVGSSAQFDTGMSDVL